MDNSKITKGEWYIKNAYSCDHKRITIKTDDCLAVGVNDSYGDFISVAICGNSIHEVVQANAELIAEAGNISQQIPFSLTELKRQRDEMLEMLKKCFYEFQNYRKAFGKGSNLESDIEQLIKESTELNK